MKQITSVQNPFIKSLVLNSYKNTTLLAYYQKYKIILNDFSTSTGTSNGVIALAGFVIGTNDSCKYGPSAVTNFSVVPTGGTGSGIGTIAVRFINLLRG